MDDETILPGELGPLPMRHGGKPITDAEALGVARRLASAADAAGRRVTIPEALPAASAERVQAAYRLPPRLLHRVRAKAEMEGVTVTDVITDALEAYASSSPGAQVAYVVGERPSAADPAAPGLVSAKEAASALGIPLARAQAWIRRARELGVEVEAPRDAWPTARTPVYDLAALRAFGATVKRGRPPRA